MARFLHHLLTTCIMMICGSILAWPSSAEEPSRRAEYCEIHVIDEGTQLGVPMVSLTTVDDVTYITDNAGRVALSEPELWGQTVFFRLSSPGYECPKDGFGIEGIRVILKPGDKHEIRLKRVQLAERLYRITGRDLYRDSSLLGQKPAIQITSMAGGVLGQDSVQSVIFQKKLYWFWGDTNRLSYPLGLFRTAGAVSQLPSDGGMPPDQGINFKYFTGKDDFVRAMVDVKNLEGVVWIHGVCVVHEKTDNAAGRDQMVAQYSRRKGLTEPLQQGIVKWNDEREIFEVAVTVDLQETWRMISDHPIVCEADGQRAALPSVLHASEQTTAKPSQWLMFGNPFPMTRVRRSLAEVTDPSSYESWTCREEISNEYPTKEQLEESRPLRDDRGNLIWRWAKQPPLTQADEKRWLKAGIIQPEETNLFPVDADQPDRRVLMHAGNVEWNDYRRKWVLIANEQGWDKLSPSFLGEVYYSEASSPQGPFTKAIRIATHPGQSFYNPFHHRFFDQNGGQTIYFEGTYCNTFTTSPATPRYNYNQLMYRLQLDSNRINEIFGPPGN